MSFNNSQHNRFGVQQELAQWLINSQSITQEELQRAKNACANTPSLSVIDALLQLGLVSDKLVAQGWCECLKLSRFKREMRPSSWEFSALPERFLRFYRVFPLRSESGEVLLVTVDPSAHYPQQALRYALGQSVTLVIATSEELEQLFATFMQPEESDKGNAQSAYENDDIAQLRDLASEAPIVRFVNQLLQQALEQGASDIHIEPFEQQIQVRYRIDGILHERQAPAYHDYSGIVSRIKIMADLDIAERRLPQDGRIMQRIQGKELDLRVSTIPTQHGESVVMRLLDRDSVRFDLDRLGFAEGMRQQFVKLLRQPNGIVLVTGPTGSGKTTSLYTALSLLNNEERKILTVEDPVEYELPGINQIQVNAAIGFDFADALRSIVRQDPDVIMVGEMRDQVTGKMAIQASLTGHLVLSTLHTNSAPASITRLIDMGLENYLVASTVNGILAQRLVRRLDPQTRIPYQASAELIERYQLQSYLQDGQLTLYRADPTAPGGGYRGRTVIAELLVMDEALREAVMQQADVDTIVELALSAGMRPMAYDGWRQVAAGITSIEEILRVTGES